MIYLSKMLVARISLHRAIFNMSIILLLIAGVNTNMKGCKIDSLKTVYNNSEKPAKKLSVLMEISSGFSNINSDSSLFYLKKAVSFSDSILTKKHSRIIERLKLKALVETGIFYRLQAKYEEAKKYFDDALLLSDKTGDELQKERIYEGLGIIYRFQGDYQKALEYELKALKIASELKDSTRIAGLYNNLGMVYFNMNEYKKAMNSFSKALAIAEKLKVYYPDVEMLDIGNIHKIPRDYTKALQYLRQALDIYRQSGDKQRIAECNYVIGDIYLLKDSVTLARKYFFDALDIFSSLKYLYGMDECYTKIGKTYKKTQNYPEAMSYYQKALKIATTQKARQIQSYILAEMSDVYLNRKNYIKAKEYAMKSLKLAEKNHFINIKNSVYKILAESYEKLGDYKNSLFYLKKYNESKDSILSREKYITLLETETRYQNLKKDMELSLLQKEKDVFREKAKKNRILNITTGIISALLLVLLLLGYFYFKQKEKALHSKAEQDKIQLKLEYDKKLVELRLITLQNKLNPHFIFNTLNSIGSVILKADKEKAYDLFTKFTALIRHTIENSENISTKLKDELDQIEKYLYLQKFRFKNKFEYHIEIDENVDLNTPVPHMFTEIFVENAIKHGLKPKKDKGKLNIEVSQNDNIITIIITDNGVGRKKAAKNPGFGTGRGIKIAREMFDLYEKLHKNKAEFEIVDLYDENGNPLGTRVIEKIIIN